MYTFYVIIIYTHLYVYICYPQKQTSILTTHDGIHTKTDFQYRKSNEEFECDNGLNENEGERKDEKPKGVKQKTNWGQTQGSKKRASTQIILHENKNGAARSAAPF
jgi:hypothetical protein